MYKLALAALCVGSAVSCAAQDVSAYEKNELPGMLDTYKQLHAHPELSHFEANTSATIVTELRKAGYTVTDHVGVYPDGSKAFGVVGILKNGAGPTLLVRGDMDALPIVEETGAPYASHVMTKNKSGQEVGVMHACGHDVHTTVLIGTARALAANKNQWHGTLMIVGQPSEETIDGAKAMLADHLYERFGKPDRIIGLHDTNQHAAGTVGLTAGPAMASSTSVDETIRGIGGHGAYPFVGRDPITLAALYITQIQTIVSREEIRATRRSSLSATSTAAPSATSFPTRSSLSSRRGHSRTSRARWSSTGLGKWLRAWARLPVCRRRRCRS